MGACFPRPGVLEEASLGCLRLLLGQDTIDVNATNDDGETAILLAARKGLIKHRDALIAHGADAAIADTTGDSALRHMM